jgi:hypothetical protein
LSRSRRPPTSAALTSSSCLPRTSSSPSLTAFPHLRRSSPQDDQALFKCVTFFEFSVGSGSLVRGVVLFEQIKARTDFGGKWGFFRTVSFLSCSSVRNFSKVIQ